MEDRPLATTSCRASDVLFLPNLHDRRTGTVQEIEKNHRRVGRRCDTRPAFSLNFQSRSLVRLLRHC